MCPFCISAVVSVAAGTVATVGVTSLFAFARRIPQSADLAPRAVAGRPGRAAAQHCPGRDLAGGPRGQRHGLERKLV